MAAEDVEEQTVTKTTKIVDKSASATGLSLRRHGCSRILSHRSIFVTFSEFRSVSLSLFYQKQPKNL